MADTTKVKDDIQEDEDLKDFEREDEQDDVDIDWLVNKIMIYCQKQAGIDLYGYQKTFGTRMVQSLVLNDGEELSALFSRQSGKVI